MIAKSSLITARELRFQNFTRLPIPDGRDAAICHGLAQCDAALVSRVAKAATNDRIAKAKHQGPTIVIDAVTERIVFDAKFDEPIVISAQKVQSISRLSDVGTLWLTK